MATANPFRFSTKFQDDETGLLYYGYRYYDPSTGRWNSRDPIGENGGDNLYAFVENTPLTQFDVIGLVGLVDSWSCCSQMPKDNPEKTLFIGFVQERWPTGTAAAWYYNTVNGPRVLLKETDRLDKVRTEIERQLGPNDCIRHIIITGHGGRQIGNYSQPKITAEGVNREDDSEEKKLLDYLRKKMCKTTKCRVDLNGCDIAASDAGKQMMRNIARTLNADVVAYDDWFALMGWGHEYTACPDGAIKSTRELPPYPWKDESSGGKRDYKWWRERQKTSTYPSVPVP